MTPATTTLPDAPSTPPAEPDSHYEVVNGQIVETPDMGAFEVHLATSLVVYLGIYARTHQLGNVESEMLFQLESDPRLERRPDVAFVCYERWPRERRITRTAAWEVVPDLAV